MARFVFIVPPLSGHVNPTLSVGAALLEQGHEVGWISLDASLEARLPTGGQLLLIRYNESDSTREDNEQYVNLISSKAVYGLDSIKFLHEEVLIPLNRYSYEGIVRWLAAFRPDVVITDHQMVAGAVAAHQQNLPYATFVTAPAGLKIMDELPKVHEWEETQLVALQNELGLETDTSIACSDKLTIVFTSKAFFGDMWLPDHYQFVGPVIHYRAAVPFDWERLRQHNRPRILVTIGTTFDHEQKKSYFAKVVDAFGGEELTVVVISNPSLLEQWPDNFIVQSHIPQVDLLPNLDAVVCHGGNNTVCETLLHGLPLVISPIAYDQSHIAGRVVQLGAGIRLNFNRFKAHHLQEAVTEILSKPAYTEAAERVKQSFQEAGGTPIAADLLIQLAQNEQPNDTAPAPLVS